jgi:hypothetical protein
MIQLTKHGVVSCCDPQVLARQFELTHAIRLPQLLGSELIPTISARIEEGNWIRREHQEIARQLELDNELIRKLLHFVVNAPEFFRLIEDITRCGPISRFVGRVYRKLPAIDHYDDWHTDVTGDRLVGLSINLSPRPYIGGTFRLAKNGSDQILCELPNLGLGDAILFRISPQLKHIVTPVSGMEPKTAFAGWFMSGGMTFLSALRESAVVS